MKRRFRIFTKRMLMYLAVAFFGIILYFALNNYDTLLAAISRFVFVFRPFIYGAVIAFLLDIPTRYFERVFRKFKKPRVLAIPTTYLCSFLVLILLVRLIAPQIIDSAFSLINNVNLYFENLNELMDNIESQFHLDPDTVNQFRISYEDVLNQLLSMLRELLPGIVDFSVKVGSGVINFLTALISSVYMLASKDKLFRQSRRALYAFTPKKAAEAVRRVIRLSSDVFSGFIGGKIFESVIVGVICFIGITIIDAFLIGIPFIPLITIIVTVTNIIPFFGPFIGAIISAMILLMVDPMGAFWFLVFILILQQFDGNYMGPKILGVSTGLPALWVLVAIIVGGGLFGITGMIAGVPALAVLHTLMRELIDNRLKTLGYDSDAVEVANGGDTPGEGDMRGADDDRGDAHGKGDTPGKGDAHGKGDMHGKKNAPDEGAAPAEPGEPER